MFNSGIILQFGNCSGKASTNATEAQFKVNTFPTAFTHLTYHLTACPTVLGPVAVAGFTRKSVTQFNFSFREGTRGSTYYYDSHASYIAIGY